jgi:hypothetical protein
VTPSSTSSTTPRHSTSPTRYHRKLCLHIIDGHEGHRLLLEASPTSRRYASLWLLWVRDCLRLCPF